MAADASARSVGRTQRSALTVFVRRAARRTSALAATGLAVRRCAALRTDAAPTLAILTLWATGNGTVIAATVGCAGAAAAAGAIRRTRAPRHLIESEYSAVKRVEAAREPHSIVIDDLYCL